MSRESSAQRKLVDGMYQNVFNYSAVEYFIDQSYDGHYVVPLQVFSASRR